ncbi:MAG: hypothetical protein B7Y26_06255 [Hydrogenophilales bacterium 16-64-46]|nr:MAG: hypothetical protein B7Z32_00365 [Hydrogenophilales bacterium 12-64-13]OYZ05922.1 MAG: hypothetical protein B7Y26_06255 [Hydrogenophilales bacterium 16-64-46]OZA39858.1 MAG: hypothetical protein B7X87_02280 [Hydrogenophilales bacterium 17-64-34]HQT00279.1 hypothetical protein [Thiobacillus sp.]
MRRAVLFLAGLLAAHAQAGWQWEAPLDVSRAVGPAVFPHVESANRKGLAVSHGTVGMVWEDNRSGTPRCYVAFRPTDAPAFSADSPVSEDECYEPVLAALDGTGRFLAAWEAAGGVWVRVLPAGKPLRLGTAASAQVTLASRNGQVRAAWAEQAGRYKRIMVATLSVKGDTVTAQSVRPVEAGEPANDQAWPALTLTAAGDVVVAWEDRRNHHTVPYGSRAPAGTRDYAPVGRLSDQRSGRVDGLGAGMGAMRPTLAAWGENGSVAVWLDKRDFLAGYDVYAAFDAGGRFAKNLRVQDSFGDNMAQWHAGVATQGTRLVVAWDDARDGTPDVWLSTWSGTGFVEDVAVPAASGPGEQSDPLLALDETGALHLVWLAREADGTRVRYARAVWR